MAIFEFGGGNTGIKEYLEEGKKQGRELSRDEIDQRIVLEGDLDICDRIIQSRETEAERYDHITLSFKEKDMTPEMMKAIAADVKEFVSAAYGKDELYFYAEAHMPKTATEQKWNVETRKYETVERRPHIHFVIPKTNMVTGERASPLELLKAKYGSKDKTMDFTDALQETINKKYGLASPKDPENRRAGFISKADMISRLKGDVFTGRNREALTMIREKMLEQRIESPEAFRKMLDGMGVVTEAKKGEYLKIKLPGHKQNVRLDGEYQFSNEFLSKSMQDKLAFYNKTGAANSVQQQAADIAKREVLLEKWSDRAREIKYLSPSSPFFKEQYSPATDAQKTVMLDRLEAAHYAKLEKEYGYVREPNEAALERMRQADGLDQMQKDALDKYAGTAQVEAFTSEKLNITYLRTTEQLREADTAGQAIIDTPGSAIDALTFSQSHFNEAALERHLLKNTADPEQYNAAMQAVLACPELVIHSDDERGLLFTSKTIVAIEKSLADRAERMAGERVGAVSAAEQQRVIDARPFNDGQRAGFVLLCSDKQLAVVNGAAGTGKSFVLAAMREAYENEGHKVYGAILQGKTAEDLERDSGIQSRTIAKMLMDLEQGKLKLDSKSVLVVDEAGMVGSRDLEKLMQHTEEAGARLRLVGDSKQLAAVEFGNAFVEVSKRAEVASLTEIMRQKTEWMKKASEKFSVHDIDGLRDYAEHGRVRLEDTTKDAQIALVSAWSEHRATQPGQSRIVLAHTNAARIELNDMMRAGLKAEGQLQNEITVTTKRGPLPMATGEQVMFTRADKDLGVKNGTTGTIAKISAEGVITVALENGKTAQFNARQDPEKGAEIDYGYCLTVHKSQGVTVDKALVLADAGMTKENLGVAMTRHRHDAELFASAEQFPTFKDMVQTLDRTGMKAFTVGREWTSAQRKEDSVIGQYVADLNAEKVVQNAAKTASYQEISANLEAKRVLDYVSKPPYGIDLAKCEIVTDKDGRQLIKQEDGKAMDAANFLTKTMHLDYKTEAAPILTQCYAEQLAKAYSEPHRTPGQVIDQTIAREFAAHQVERTAQYKADKEALDEAKRTKAADIEKSSELDADKAKAQAELAKSTKADKKELKAEYDRPTGAVYKDFLAVKALESPKHLQELARVSVTPADRERLALVTVQVQGIPCLTPDFKNLTAAQIQKGVSHVLNSSPDNGRPPAHIIARNAAAFDRARAADNLIRDPERAQTFEAEGGGSVHELPHGGVDGNRQVDRSVLPGSVHESVGDGKAGQYQNVRRTGASEDRGGERSVTPPVAQAVAVAVAVEPAHQVTPAPGADATTPLSRSEQFNQQAQRAAAPAAEKGGGMERKVQQAEAKPVEAGITAVEAPAQAAGEFAKGITESMERVRKAGDPAQLAEAHRKEQEEAEAKATEAAKAAEVTKAAEAERLAEPAQLADIAARIETAKAEAHHHSPLRDKPAVLAEDADYNKSNFGKIIASNETLIAVDIGRKINIFKAAELDKNLTYDGIATGPDRFAIGNKIELKQTSNGQAKAILSEEREKLQTEQRKEIERGIDNGIF
jgi:Ti-type conjugative transfer relaxase TraA